MVIVLSILLAFSVEAAWEGRNDAVGERELRGRLLADFEESRERITQSVRNQQAGSSAAFAFLRIVRDEGDPPGSYQIPDTILNSISGAPAFRPARGALVSALSSGSIALMDDEALKADMARWDDDARRLESDLDLMRTRAEEVIIPILMEVVPFTSIDFRQRIDGFEAPSRFEADYRPLFRSLVLENWVEYQAYGYASSLAAANTLGALTDRIIDRLGS